MMPGIDGKKSQQPDIDLPFSFNNHTFPGRDLTGAIPQ